jgi:hypothetical protein
MDVIFFFYTGFEKNHPYFILYYAKEFITNVFHKDKTSEKI